MDEQAAGRELKWHTSVWPFLLSIGILFLAPLSFAFYFVYAKPMMSVLSLGIGIPLTLISIAGWIKEGLRDVHGYSSGLSIWAMPLFILSEAIIFAGLFAAYWVLRLTPAAWPPEGTPAMPVVVPVIMTAVLLISSITIYIGGKKADEDNGGGYLSWLVITISLGAIFIGLSAYEWGDLVNKGFTIRTNIYSTAFYSITGFHTAHVAAGVGIFVCVLLSALAGTINTAFVRVSSIYWHFVDIAWLFVVSQVYFW